MTNRIAFEKSLTASSSNNICTSQSVTGGVGALINGAAAANFLSTTTTAATTPVPSSTNIPTVLKMTSVTGVVVGQGVTDTTTSTALAAGTTVAAVGSLTVTLSRPVTGDGATGTASGVGSGDTIVFAGTAIIDTAANANFTALGRRIVLGYTGSDTSFAITGTNAFGNVITETIVGASGAGNSAFDYVTVTSIVPVGSITAFTAGTTSTGSGPWWIPSNTNYPPMNISAAVELVSGAATYTVEYTYDDPNNLTAGLTAPLAMTNSTPAALIGGTTTKDGLFNFPLMGVRLTITSGSGVLRTRFEQAGIG
jgi:hypothetical protein